MMKRRSFLKGLLFSAMMPVALAFGAVKTCLYRFKNPKYEVLYNNGHSIETGHPWVFDKIYEGKTGKREICFRSKPPIGDDPRITCWQMWAEIE